MCNNGRTCIYASPASRLVPRRGRCASMDDTLVVRACENAASCFREGNFSLISRREFSGERENGRGKETLDRSRCNGNRFPATSQQRKRIGARPRERLPAITPTVGDCLFLISEKLRNRESPPALRIAPVARLCLPRHANAVVASPGIRALHWITFSLSLK